MMTMDKELLSWLEKKFSRRPLTPEQIRDIYNGWRLSIRPSIMAVVVGCGETTIRKHYTEFDNALWLKRYKVKEWS